MIAGGMRGRTAITHRLRVTIRSAERRLFMRLKQRDFRATFTKRNYAYDSERGKDSLPPTQPDNLDQDSRAA